MLPLQPNRELCRSQPGLSMGRDLAKSTPKTLSLNIRSRRRIQSSIVLTNKIKLEGNGPASDRMLQRPRNFSKAFASVSAKSKYFFACSASWAFKADSARERNLSMRSLDDAMSPRKPKPCARCASLRVFKLWAMPSARLDKRSRSWLNRASLGGLSSPALVAVPDWQGKSRLLQAAQPE
jgi:hypothetical protein